jgi:hypothetical protein
MKASAMGRLAKSVLAATLLCVSCMCPTPAEPASSVRVRVADGDGHPVASAAIYAREKHADVLLAHTDTQGVAMLAVTLGTVLFARSNGTDSSSLIVTGHTLQFLIGIKMIASVTARNPIGSTTIGTQNVTSIVSGDVGDALQFVPNYRSQAEGGSGNMELNGTPLSLPTGPEASRFALPSDLISSFSPDQADDGSITPNYHLESPSGTPQTQLSLLTGSQGQGLFKDAVTGPNYAFVLADRYTQGRLAGQSFADASGLFYDHSSDSHELSGSADIEFRLGGAHVSVVGFGSERRNAQLDLVDPGTIPEGPGPGNEQSTKLASGYARITQSRGRDDWSALHVEYAGAATDDDLASLAERIPIPTESGFNYSGRYDEMTVTRNFETSSATIKINSSQSLASSFVSPFESTSVSSGTTLALSTSHTNQRSSFNTNVEATRETGPFTTAHINASFGGTLSSTQSHLRWDLYSAQSQVLQTYYADALTMSVPGAADFSCGGHAAFASGPSDVTPNAPHSVGLTASGSRSFNAIHTKVTLGGFVSQTTNALVIAASASNAALPPGYLDELNAQYASLCGGAPLTPSDLYLTHYVSVPRQIDKEGYASSSTSFGRFGLVTGYETYSAVALGVSKLSQGTNSTLINGAQIWNIPLHRASAVLSYRDQDATFGLGITYVSANSSSHLPANFVTSAGIRLATRGGIVTLSMQNLFHQDVSEFNSASLSAPTAMTGAPVGFIATPITPTWSLHYDVRVGQGVSTE